MNESSNIWWFQQEKVNREPNKKIRNGNEIQSMNEEL